jgi:hypothetical protein
VTRKLPRLKLQQGIEFAGVVALRCRINGRQNDEGREQTERPTPP